LKIADVLNHKDANNEKKKNEELLNKPEAKKEEYLKREHINSLGKHTIVIKMLDKSGEFSVFVEPIK
jgi:hypothetical protein